MVQKGKTKRSFQVGFEQLSKGLWDLIIQPWLSWDQPQFPRRKKEETQKETPTCFTLDTRLVGITHCDKETKTERPSKRQVLHGKGKPVSRHQGGGGGENRSLCSQNPCWTPKWGNPWQPWHIVSRNYFSSGKLGVPSKPCLYNSVVQ